MLAYIELPSEFCPGVMHAIISIQVLTLISHPTRVNILSVNLKTQLQNVMQTGRKALIMTLDDAEKYTLAP